MKLTLYLLFALTASFTFAQENFKFPTYPGCEKRKTNEDLQECFYKKLNAEIQSEFDDQDLFWLNNNNIDQSTLVFTVTKEGKLEKFSYTKESNSEAAKFFLKHIYRVKKHYESRNKKFSPAIKDGKTIDFQIQYRLNYHQLK